MLRRWDVSPQEGQFGGWERGKVGPCWIEGGGLDGGVARYERVRLDRKYIKVGHRGVGSGTYR